MYNIEAKNLMVENNSHKVELEVTKSSEKILETSFSCSYHQFKNKRQHLFVSAVMIELERKGLESFAEDYNVSDFKNDGRVELTENFDIE